MTSTINKSQNSTHFAQYPQLQTANFGFWTNSWRRLPAVVGLAVKCRGIFAAHKVSPSSPKTKRAEDVICPDNAKCVNTRKKGSSLITVVVLSIVAITMLTSAVYLVGVLLVSTVAWQSSVDAHIAAESGADDALMKVALNPTLPPGAGSATVTIGNAIVTETIITPVSPNSAGTIYSKGEVGLYSKKIKVEYKVDADGVLTVLSRKDTLE